MPIWAKGRAAQKARIRNMYLRTVIPVVALVLIQGLVLTSFVFLFGMMDMLDAYSEQTLHNQTQSRSSSIITRMNSRMNDTNEMANRLAMQLRRMQREAEDAGRSVNSASLSVEMLDASMDSIVSFVRNQVITGAYLILETPDQSGNPDTRMCLYLRDSSPDILTANNSDLVFEVGPDYLVARSQLSRTARWTSSLDMSQGDVRFYTKTVEAATEYPMLYEEYCAYWSPPADVRGDDIRAVTYSVPLRGLDGEVIGVFGVELSEEYLASVLPYTELALADGAFLIMVETEEGLLTENCVASGPTARRLMDAERLTLDGNLADSTELTGIHSDRRDLGVHSGTVFQINVYSARSPFLGNERWYFAGLAPDSSIHAVSNTVLRGILLTALVTSAIGLAMAVVISRYIIKPVTEMAGQVRALNPTKPVELERTGLREMDQLSDALELMSARATRSAARMSTLINLVGMPIGGFEVDNQTGLVYLTESMYRIADIPPGSDGGTTITFAEWEAFLATLTSQGAREPVRNLRERIYSCLRSGQKVWYRMRYRTERDGIHGVLVDITDEMLAKQRMETERSFDAMTRLLNRSAFSAAARERIEGAPDKVGVLLFCDLDNLKTINDTYGHDAGNWYIKKAAEGLRTFEAMGGAVARLSGDEFVVYLHGFATRQEALERFRDQYLQARSVMVYTDADGERKVEMSAGIAFYPGDSAIVEDLVRYADFAMYEAKRNEKGSLRAFDSESYGKNAFRYKQADLLDQLLEEGRVRFYFQPIVDARDGSIFAYEAFMRPDANAFHTLGEMLELARAQNRMDQVERLTYTEVMRWLSQNMNAMRARKVFINSVAGQLLSDSDRDVIYQKYGDLFRHTVTEITGQEYDTPACITRKLEMLRNWGGQVAVSNFGLGGALNQRVLYMAVPDYVKIDMSIVRDIDRDLTRYGLAQEIVEIAQSRGLAVIAEGVETAEEMSALCRLGVHYLQGYYLGEPQEDLGDIAGHALAGLEALRGQLDLSGGRA